MVVGSPSPTEHDLVLVLRKAVSDALSVLGNRRLKGHTLQLTAAWYDAADAASMKAQLGNPAPFLAFMGLNLERGDRNIILTEESFRQWEPVQLPEETA